MIEITILDHLNAELTPPCYMEMPETLPSDGKFVILEKTSSGEKDKLKTATVAVQSYAPSLYQAMQLNESVKSAMFSLISNAGVSASMLNSDYNFTDTRTKSYRYQAVFDVYYY